MIEYYANKYILKIKEVLTNLARDNSYFLDYFVEKEIKPILYEFSLEKMKRDIIVEQKIQESLIDIIKNDKNLKELKTISDCPICNGKGELDDAQAWDDGQQNSECPYCAVFKEGYLNGFKEAMKIVQTFLIKWNENKAPFPHGLMHVNDLFFDLENKLKENERQVI